MENIKAQAQAKIDAREVNVPKAIPWVYIPKVDKDWFYED
jgi:hypothetical protein